MKKILILFLLVPLSGISQFEGLTTGLAIDRLMTGLSNVISDAQQAGAFVTMRAGHEAKDVLYAYKNANKEILDKAFGEISDERKAIINETNQILTRLERDGEMGLSQAESMLDQLHRMVRDVTFKNYPVLFRYRGTVLVPGETQTIRVVVNGSKINKGKPYLLLRGKKYPAIVSGENLIFNLPRTIFEHKDYNTELTHAKLVVYHVHGGLFGVFFQEIDEVEYGMEFAALPKNLAKATIEYNKITIIQKDSLRIAPEVSHNSSSRSWNYVNFSYEPINLEKGGRFDTSRTFIEELSGNSDGQIVNEKISSTAVTFQIRCKRDLLDKGNGFRHAKAHLFEVWEETETEKLSKTIPIGWNEDVLVRLDEGSQDYILTATFFTGNTKVLTNSGRIFKYADVEMNEEKNAVVIKPVPPKDILGL